MNTYEAYGYGITDKWTDGGRVIRGKTPMDALRRAKIPFVRRVHKTEDLPEHFIIVRSVAVYGGHIHRLNCRPTCFYEVQPSS